MSNFRTIVPIKPIQKLLTYDDKFFLMGSCFSENIGNCLKTNQFQQMINPFGIIFNLASLARIIQRIINLECFTANDVLENQGIWSCFDVHSNQNALNKEKIICDLNNQLEISHHFLKNTTAFILTIGTSWVYKHIASNQIVANCHKLPTSQFEKILLSQVDNFKYLNQIISNLKTFNPKIRVIFTVSPVRHIKDGFFENNVSKALIISAIYQLNMPNVYYFPSYEIIQDELRDYRFYADDMLHPNESAIKYIWQRFILNYFDTSTIQTMVTVETINKMKFHRPFLNNTPAHNNFLNDLNKKIKAVQIKHDWFFRNEVT